MTESMLTELALRQRDRLLQGATDAMAHLLARQDMDVAIGAALAELGRVVDVDRVYIFENHQDPATGEPLLSQRHEWCAGAASAQIDNPELQNLAYKTFSLRWYHTLASGAAITGLVKEFPASERAVLEPQDILSILVLPIHIQGHWWGFIGFDDCRRERTWTASEENILRTAAIGLGNAYRQFRAELELRASEVRFHDLLTLASDWFWELDERFRFTLFAPDATAYVLKHTEADAVTLLGQTPWALPLDWSPEQAAAQRALMEAHQPFRDLEHSIRISADTYRWLNINGKPLFDDAGRFTGYRGTARDITERRQAEQTIRQLNAELEQRVEQRTAELAAANKELEAFAYSVSHDLRAPLRGIDGFSQAMLEDYAAPVDATGQDYLQRIRAAAQYMARLINDLLQLSRLSQAALTRQPVDMSALAREVAAELQAREPARHGTWQIADGLITEGDPQLLRVLLDNLLGNAWKYTRYCETPQITVGQMPGDRETAFFVRDNGAGFDMAYAAQLFRPFQRLHDARDYEGTGIGLATVQRVVRRHGGRVWAEATPGQGATFYFTLNNT